MMQTISLLSSPLAAIAIKSTAVMAVGLLAAWLARGNRASVRHSLLASTFGVLLALPLVSLLSPPIRIAIAPVQPQTEFAAASTVQTVATEGVAIETSSPLSGKFPLPSMLLALWGAGVAIFLLPVGVGLWQVYSLRRAASPWPLGQAMADGLARDAGIRRRVEVLLHQDERGTLPGPMTCGAVHPAIVLPCDTVNWEADDLSRAIVHELEHVRRGDWIMCCVARAICAWYWFHPLVWIAWRRLMLEAERSCDDAVLSRSEATAYADQLVGLAKQFSTARRSPMMAMASRVDLSARVGALLDSRRRRGRAGRLVITAACAGAVALVLALSPLQAVAAPQAVGAGVEPSAASAPRYASTTAFVVLNVSVSDKNGNAVGGLYANDFLVTEDGVAQVISLFEPQTLGQNSNYYVLGYYTRNQNENGAFRKVGVYGNKDTMADLSYRMGYYGDVRSDAAPASRLEAGSPIPIFKPEAQYSEQARKAKWQGTATLAVQIDASGRVTDMRVMHPLGLGLDEKAMEAVKQWTFMPAMKNGTAVAVEAEVDVHFRLL